MSKYKELFTDETVILKLVPEKADPTLSKTSDGYIKLEGTAWETDIPRNSSGMYAIMTAKEQADLEKKIDSNRKPGWLLPTKLDNNAWFGKKRYVLSLGVDPVILHLNNPMDCIKYIIAKANIDLIAPSWEERLNRDYLYYMEYESDANRGAITEGNRKLKAYMTLNDIKGNRSKLLDMMLMLFNGDYNRIQRNITTEKLEAGIFDYIEKNTESFLLVAESTTFDDMLKFYLAVAAGAIVKGVNGYYLGYSNGEHIGSSEGDVIHWINDIKSDDGKSNIYEVLKQRITSYRDKR